MNDLQGSPIYNELFARLSCLRSYLHGSRVYDEFFQCSPVYSELFAT